MGTYELFAAQACAKALLPSAHTAHNHQTAHAPCAMISP
ncbi:hypothetical protein YSA_05245 [Pseudomonas putida ND6]|uniref:Uncharacterized protein n=1 Tax=Pseudomonas putida ND6 TaxID=231023 RepID=I3UVT7_PSEPU|nr:hypothetical protein YSA_05245 [Pseudomonas putida ND6]